MQQVAALREPQEKSLIATAIANPGNLPSELKREQMLIVASLATVGALPAPPTAGRTVVHTYEPVRNAQHEVVDFRLSFDCALASEAARSFRGVQVVQCGPSVAPGEIFHTLKRVLESGESQETVTRHRLDDHELCFHQTALKVGDAVTTTTSIVSNR